MPMMVVGPVAKVLRSDPYILKTAKSIRQCGMVFDGFELGF
jgi:hypothetical protein